MNNLSDLDITSSSTGNDSLLDEDLLSKNLFLSQEIKSLRNLIQEREKEISEDNEIELVHQTEINDNQNKLIKFYKNQGNTNLIINNDNINIINILEDKLKQINKQYEITKNKVNELEIENTKNKNEIIDLKDTNEKMLNLLTEQEMEKNEIKNELEKLREYYNNQEIENNKKLNNSENDNSENENLDKMKELYIDLENEFEEYKKKNNERFNNISNEIIENQELKEKINELNEENEMLMKKLQEQIKYNEEIEMNYHNNSNTQNQVLINEIDDLQNIIRDLEQSKSQLITNSKE